MTVLRRLLSGGLGRPPWDLPGRRRGERYLVLVRAGASDAPGGSLSPEGRAQAESMAGAVAPLGPLAIVVAPEPASRETAARLEARWTATAREEPALAWPHLPAGSTWSEPRPDEAAWRQDVVAAIYALGDDTVVVAGAEVVAVVVGEATGQDVVSPDQAPAGSRTTLRLGPDGIRLLRLGQREGPDH